MRGEGREHAGAERISAPIFVPLVIVIALLMASMTYGVAWLVQHENEARMGRHLRQAVALFYEQLGQEAEALDIALYGIIRDPAYAPLLRSGDRAGLQRLAVPLYEHLRDDHQVTHFYVDDPTRIVLLRAHDPKLYGDRIDRLTAREAERTGGDAWGMELGPLGSLTLRSVMPYRAGGQLLGYFELGKEVGHIVDRVHRILGIDLLVLIDKRSLNRTGWETGHRMFHWPLDWDSLPNVAIADSTITDLPQPLIRRLATADSEGAVAAGDLAADGRTLHLASVALTDAGGNRVGSLVVIVDMTSLAANSRMLIGGVGLLGVALGTALLLLFRRIIGRVERRVANAIGSLARSNADLERLTYVTCHDLQGAVEGLAESAECLTARHRACLGADGARLLESVLSQTYRVREIVETIEDYLDLDINARKEQVRMDAVVMAAMEKLGLVANGITVEPLPVLSARPVPLAHAVLRLMEAAQEPQTPNARRKLHIAAATADGWWRIAFTDNGSGDTPTRREAIAEARRIAELHGGELLSAAIPEGGRTVTLVLPADDAQAPAATA